MTEATDHNISILSVQEILGSYSRLYEFKPPYYQTVLLNDLQRIWQGCSQRLLDIGGGTGLIGQCMLQLLDCKSVTSIDIDDRFHPNLTISTRVYDGRLLPFDDSSFDAATFNNVIHHIPPNLRVEAFREVNRAVAGPVYIKDHLSGSRLDHLRLSLLDVIGNLPSGGMVRANYLSMEEWDALAKAAGFRITEVLSSKYRSGLYAVLFPNRLEIAMRWERA